MSNKSLTPVNVLALSSAPTTPTLKVGDMYYNTGGTGLMVWTGSIWKSVADVNPTMADGGQPDSLAPYNGGYYNTVATQVLEGGTP